MEVGTDDWVVNISIVRELVGALVASQAPSVPEWFWYENRDEFTVKRPEASCYQTDTALKAYTHYREGSLRASDWYEFAEKDPAVAKVAEQIYAEREGWAVRKKFFLAREQHRVEMLWRAKWTGDLVKAIRAEARQ